MFNVNDFFEIISVTFIFKQLILPKGPFTPPSAHFHTKISATVFVTINHIVVNHTVGYDLRNFLYQKRSIVS